jgi:hypothetical protein
VNGSPRDWLYGITYLTEGEGAHRNNLFWRSVPVGLLTDPLERQKQAIAIAAICNAIEFCGDTPESVEQVSEYRNRNESLDIEPFQKAVEEQVAAYWAQFKLEKTEDWNI